MRKDVEGGKLSERERERERGGGRELNTPWEDNQSNLNCMS